jgi:hypothetical protein
MCRIFAEGMQKECDPFKGESCDRRNLRIRNHELGDLIMVPWLDLDPVSMGLHNSIIFRQSTKHLTTQLIYEYGTSQNKLELGKNLGTRHQDTITKLTGIHST